jgi:hypothetical protein
MAHRIFLLAVLLIPSLVSAATIFSTSCKIEASDLFLAEGTIYTLAFDFESSEECLWKYYDRKPIQIGCKAIGEPPLVEYSGLPGLLHRLVAESLRRGPYKLNFPFDVPGHLDALELPDCLINYSSIRVK